ncbi:methyl-accepting chemotaxis protein [Bacillus tianshenii]|nr:methyl-accepting chemotaxis protein [Bacillus tianshenii]
MLNKRKKEVLVKEPQKEKNDAEIIRLSDQLRQYKDLSTFNQALLSYTLAHTDLITFQTSLKIQHVADKVTEIASMSEQMSAIMEDVSSSTEELNVSMQGIKDTSVHIMDELITTSKVGNEVKELLYDSEHHIHHLQEELNNINYINKSVAEIADQTNLLSLNAMIEAARAGEHGRGFNVVAKEVGKLANHTKKSLNEVQHISKKLDKTSKLTIDNVLGVKTYFDQFLTGQLELSTKIDQNTDTIKEASSALHNISNATQENTTAIENLSTIATELAETSDFSQLIETEKDNLISTVSSSFRVIEEESVIGILSARLIDHAHFLHHTIQIAGKGQRLNSHTECNFGKWYYNNYQQHRHLPGYKAIELPHKALHEAAQQLSDELTITNAERVVTESQNILEAFLIVVNAFLEND